MIGFTGVALFLVAAAVMVGWALGQWVLDGIVRTLP